MKHIRQHVQEWTRNLVVHDSSIPCLRSTCEESGAAVHTDSSVLAHLSGKNDARDFFSHTDIPVVFRLGCGGRFIAVPRSD